MKIWKVILATIVIFAAGALTGGILTRTFSKPPAPKPPVPPILSQQRFQDKLKRELQLTSEQTNRIDRIFAESKERVRILWGLVGPELQKELQEVRENIRAELTPEQRVKFEELLKQPPHKDGRRGSRGGTNQANLAPITK